jgi:hypothetical protein
MRYSIYTVILGLMLFVSCEREAKRPPKLTAGTGGNALLHITPVYHERSIDSSTVYIKYNAWKKPDTYDDSAKCKKVDGKPIATIAGLKEGCYYFFVKSWDSVTASHLEGEATYIVPDEIMYEFSIPVK